MVAAPVAGTGKTVFELTAVVHEGRHFPVDSSFEVRGVFDSEESATGLTRASTSPVWGGSLVWRRDAKQIRKLQSQGSKLKLTGPCERAFSSSLLLIPPRQTKEKYIFFLNSHFFFLFSNDFSSH